MPFPAHLDAHADPALVPGGPQRAEGPRIRLSVNGRQTVDYTEPDSSIPRDGLIGLQVHGGGKVEAWYKDITIEALK